MRTFDIPVRNESTGEIRVVVVECDFDVDAQVTALHKLFREEGWRRATALRPEAEVSSP